VRRRRTKTKQREQLKCSQIYTTAQNKSKREEGKGGHVVAAAAAVGLQSGKLHSNISKTCFNQRPMMIMMM